MIALVYRNAYGRTADLALELKEKLAALNCPAQLVENRADKNGILPENTSLILSLGGDGTMLGAVRLWAEHGLDNQVPIIGINLGGLGFLTSLTPQEVDGALQAIINNQIPTQLRTLLEARVEGKESLRYIALNEVVVGKSLASSLLELEVLADKRHLVSLRADGIIIATPTGSSAYNLSAGGPICHPVLDCLILTPICSFNFSNRPLIMPPDLELCIRILSNSSQAGFTCDGQVGLDLQPGERLIIRRAKRQVRLGAVHDYFEILRNKLKWG